MSYSLKELVGSADLVVVSPEDPRTMVKRPQECKTLDIPYVYDPSQQIIRLSAEELAAGMSGCFLLVVNEYEFGMIREEDGLGRGGYPGARRRADQDPGG